MHAIWPLSHAVFVGLLALACLFFPLPVYLASLALFGLPHIICEMFFLRRRYAKRWSRGWWAALCLVLLLQAWMRSGLWWGNVTPDISRITDMLSLAMLGALVAFAPSGVGYPVRVAGLVLGALIIGLLQADAVTMTLLALAMLHNFTPVALVWDMAHEERTFRPLAWRITSMFCIPFLFVAAWYWLRWMPSPSLGWPGWAGSAAVFFLRQSTMLNAQLPVSWHASSGLLPALVLAQCLHYYCVIRLLPQAQKTRTGRPLWSAATGIAIGILLFAMTVYFFVSYDAARLLYAVAAGAHAWLEWPVLLMAMLSMRQCCDAPCHDKPDR